MPSAITSVIGGMQGGGQPAANPYAGAPGLNQQQAANILQQLRGGMGIGNGGGSMMGALPAGANPQAALAQMVGAPPQNSMTALPAGASPQGALAMMGLNPQNSLTAMPGMQSLVGGNPQASMQGFNGFGGMAPMQASAYAGNPQQAALQGMVRGLGGRSPMQPGAYAQPQAQAWGPSPFAWLGQ